MGAAMNEEAELALQEFAKRWIGNDARVKAMKAFLLWVKKPIADITKQDIMEYCAPTMQYTTWLNFYKVCFRQFFDDCIRMGFRENNPIDAISDRENYELKQRMEDPYALTVTEMKRVCRMKIAEDRPQEAFIFCSLYEGLQKKDIASLRKSDVQDGFLNIRGGYHFEMSDFHAEIMENALNATFELVWHGPSGSYVEKYFPDSAYVLRPSRDEDTYDDRMLIFNNRYRRAGFPLTPVGTRRAGLMYHIKQCQKTLGEEKFKIWTNDLAQRYGLSWRQVNEALRVVKSKKETQF